MDFSFLIPRGLDLVCTDGAPSVFGILDPSIAPLFLYYSYVPIIFVALLFGLGVFLASHASLVSRLFLWIAITFSVLIAGEILLWIAVPVYLIHFAWQLTALWHILLVVLIAHFAYVFIRDEKMPIRWQWILVILVAPVLALIPSTLNLAGFDIENCESISGMLWTYIYEVEISVALVILAFCVLEFRARIGHADRGSALILGIGICIFWVAFILSNLIGDVTLVYNINLVGPVGMVVLLATLAFLIVRYHAFNLRIFGAQALIISLFALLFAALFIEASTVRYVIAGTLLLVAALGTVLVRSVRKEIQQKEEIELQEKELEIANKQQESLLHFISHEIKGYLAKSAAAFASISDGDYGAVPAPLKTMSDAALVDVRRGVDTVMDILDASNLKKGTVAFAKKSFDLSKLLSELVTELQPTATAKGLVLEFKDSSGGGCVINGDEEKIRRHVFRNVIDNSIKYTPKGKVSVEISKHNSLIRTTIADTGVGITPEDKMNLFTEGGHGKDSLKINVHSTGYGLFIAKQITEAHGGKIWAESDGEGKGSRFIIELPAGSNAA